MHTTINLDEIPERDLLAELQLRAERRRRGQCDYCGRPSTDPACRFPDRHGPPEPQYVNAPRGRSWTVRATITEEDQQVRLVLRTHDHASLLVLSLLAPDRDAAIGEAFRFCKRHDMKLSGVVDKKTGQPSYASDEEIQAVSAQPGDQVVARGAPVAHAKITQSGNTWRLRITRRKTGEVLHQCDYPSPRDAENGAWEFAGAVGLKLDKVWLEEE